MGSLGENGLNVAILPKLAHSSQGNSSGSQFLAAAETVDCSTNRAESSLQPRWTGSIEALAPLLFANDVEELLPAHAMGGVVWAGIHTVWLIVAAHDILAGIARRRLALNDRSL